MITKELAMTLRVGQEVWHNTGTNKDGTPLRARVNGKCKTWKTRECAFKLPMKKYVREAASRLPVTKDKLEMVIMPLVQFLIEHGE